MGKNHSNKWLNLLVKFRRNVCIITLYITLRLSASLAASMQCIVKSLMRFHPLAYKASKKKKKMLNLLVNLSQKCSYH